MSFGNAKKTYRLILKTFTNMFWPRKSNNNYDVFFLMQNLKAMPFFYKVLKKASFVGYVIVSRLLKRTAAFACIALKCTYF